MTPGVASILKKLREGFYHQFRQELPADFWENLPYSSLPEEASMLYRKKLLEQEKPVVLPGEKIIFLRTLPKITEFAPLLDPQVRAQYDYLRPLENLTPDWAVILRDGISGRLKLCRELMQKTSDPEKLAYYRITAAELENITAFALRYAAAATDESQKALLEKVPIHPAESFHEALQCLRFMTGCLRSSDMNHIGFGRFDQYMMPYLQRDLDNGTLTLESAGELLAEFFLSLNRDSDLYVGVQQGDNGQSLMLGGCDKDGNCVINPLTYMVLEVSEELGVIDPKINLRIDKSTPQDLLLCAARLTRRGLGFPQYCNDEVVIPGLVEFGYDLADARDYTVAACWEFVMPHGRDIPNLLKLNLPLIADRAIRKTLKAGGSFEDILTQLKVEMTSERQQLQDLIDGLKKLFLPDMLFSSFFSGCLERGMDLHKGGGKYYNFGCHGPGAVNAANALAVVKAWVFDEKRLTAERLLNALENNWDGEEDLRQDILHNAPQAGNNSDLADEMLQIVFDTFCDVLTGWLPGERQTRVRPGTGSAQSYVFLTQNQDANGLHATADGRRDGDFIGSSLSVAPMTRSQGVLSLFHTFGKLNYKKLINGGPITMELADAYFKEPEALEKTVLLVRSFVNSGNQQLQLNTLNPDRLRDAQKHPENYRDLVVRVWGWSGYFVELAKPFQDQIIGRQAFGA